MAEALCIGGMDARLAEDGIVIAPFVRGIISEVFVIVVTVLMIASEVAVPVSCATVVRTGAMIDVLTGMVFSAVTVFVNVNVSSGVYTNT